MQFYKLEKLGSSDIKLAPRNVMEEVFLISKLSLYSNKISRRYFRVTQLRCFSRLEYCQTLVSQTLIPLLSDVLALQQQQPAAFPADRTKVEGRRELAQSDLEHQRVAPHLGRK